MKALKTVLGVVAVIVLWEGLLHQVGQVMADRLMSYLQLIAVIVILTDWWFSRRRD